MRRRPGETLRADARRRRLAFLRLLGPRLPLLVLLLALVGTVWILAAPTDFLAGYGLGTIATAGVAIVVMEARDSDGGRSLRLGIEGEQATAEMLVAFARRRMLRRERWRAVHSIGFAAGDVDHVLVGPGGVYVVESKLRVAGNGADPAAVVRDGCRQLARAASRIRAVVAQHGGVDVEPSMVLVLWGRGFPWPDGVDHVVREGVLVVRGGRQAALRQLPGSGLEAAVAERCVVALRTFAHRSRRT